jgi:CHAT domain-containing protein
VSGGGTFIEIESALIQRLFPTQLIERDYATAQQVTDALNQSHRMLHFSGHGAYNSYNPAQSCLFLAGNDRLTLQTLAHLDLSAYDLICLAACETGITGRQTITDEYVGLSSAFLKAKATHIVSTFWRVDSAASLYFMVEFYQELAAGQSPYLALQHAQTFLKSATRQDLITWIDAAPSDLPKSYRIALREERELLAEIETEHPYAHPYYWSAFSIAGL